MRALLEWRCQKSIRAKYQNQIEIYTGIEADYLKNTVSPSDFAELNLDFCIGSIHYLQPKRAELPWDFIISPKVFQEGLNDFYDNDIHALIRDYFQANCEMIEAGGINIIGHCDQIRKFNKGNRFFEESDPIYQKYLHEMFDLIAEKKIIVEINTRGKLKHLTQNFFPSNSSLKICKDKGIRIMLSADAHKPDECNSYLTEAAQTALNSGFTKISIIENGKFIEHNIKEFANVLV